MSLLSRPGERGLVVLGLVTIVAIGFGVSYGHDRVSCHNITLSLVALLFFLWAVHKNIQNESFDDFGAITFALVLLAGACTPRYSPGLTQKERMDRAVAAVTRLGITTACVCAHYAYVLFTLHDVKPSFKLYLLAGAVWWFSAMVWTVSALLSHIRSLQMQNTEHDLESEALMEASTVGRFRVLLAQ